MLLIESIGGHWAGIKGKHSSHLYSPTYGHAHLHAVSHSSNQLSLHYSGENGFVLAHLTRVAISLFTQCLVVAGELHIYTRVHCDVRILFKYFYLFWCINKVYRPPLKCSNLLMIHTGPGKGWRKNHDALNVIFFKSPPIFLK